MSKQFAFVVAPTDGSSASIAASERLKIRRHCMQKKNKRPDSRRSKRESARKSASSATASESIGISEKQDRVGRGSCHSQPPPTRSAVLPPTMPARDSAMSSAYAPSYKLAISPPSDWALFRFAEEMDWTSQKMMHQCTWSIGAAPLDITGSTD
jgi:hypothetical protein